MLQSKYIDTKHYCRNLCFDKVVSAIFLVDFFVKTFTGMTGSWTKPRVFRGGVLEYQEMEFV